MIKDFVIPVNKDDLLNSSHEGQYVVENVIPIRMLMQALDATRASLQEKGADFILEHFDTFFAVVVHGNKVELQIVMRAFNRIIKAIEALVHDMEGIIERGNEIEGEDRLRYLCVNKMLAYLFSWFVCHIDDEILKNAPDKFDGKRKKPKKSDIEEEWETSREKALEYVYRWLQLPLQKLWQPPIIEDSFMMLLTKVCYKILEQCKDAKQKHIRQTIFEILGTAVKRYNQGISCVVRIIQLVKLHDVLASHIATGVVHMAKNHGCNGLIKKVLMEIDQTELAETDSRNISIFLESIAITEPDLIIPILDDMVDYLGSEHYTMRNCTLGILGAVVQKALTRENLTQEQKEKRDECLNNLEAHILDVNAYVRSKSLQIWQKLCCEGAIPLARQGRLLAATTLRLEDKSANVRKQALQLVRALLQSNPFAAKLNKVELTKSLEEERAKLRKLQTEFASNSVRGDNERLELWNNLLPDIRTTIKQIITDVKEDEDEEDMQCEDDIDTDKAFEHIRQLMLKEKIIEAVTYLWTVCAKLKDAPQMEGLSQDAKEECIFLLLLKIFMESEDGSNKLKKNVEAPTLVDIDKQKEDMKARKRVVNYLENCLEFATELEAAIPMAENLLFSTTASDAIEACTLVGTACQFGVVGAAAAVQSALYQVFHRDQSVRTNVALVYQQIYLNFAENQKTERQKAVMCVKALIDLLKGLQPGQSTALAQLIITWYKNEELSNEVLQVLWEKFSMKSSDTTPLDSRTALMLITMISHAESGIITGNLEVLIKVGLGPRAKSDLLLARDTCRALLKIKHDNSDFEKPPVRYPNDHDMFKEILTLIKENFINAIEDGYVSFVTDAVSVIYHLANQPDHLMKDLLLDVFNRGQFNNSSDLSQQPTVPFYLLSKLLYLVGHVSIKQMVYLDTSVYKELKRRDTIRKLKKGKTPGDNAGSRKSRVSNIVLTTPTSAGQTLRNKETSTIMEDNGEEAVEGAADDPDAEFITATLENQVVTGDGMLAKFIPLVLDVCQHPDKYNNEHLQASGALALSKMMTVSSSFCEESLQLLITILERSPYPGIRANVLIGISDLTARFPNQVEPWMKHLYGRLRDENIHVRRTCVRVLSSLIMREMVRVRGQVSELALCIVDKDTQISQDAKQFFKELSQKGNALYNVMPDILSRLTDPELNLKENNFQEIFKYILSLMQKEKQVDAIIEKICTRFKLASTERQWRDFSYCLSLLQFSGKSIRRLIESLPLLKEKIHHPQVLKALQSVIDQTKKKPNARLACIELEEKIQELLKSTENAENAENSEKTDSQAMPPPPVPTDKTRKKTAKRSRRKGSSEEEEDDVDSDSETTPVATAKGSKKKKSVGRNRNSSSGSDSDTDDVPVRSTQKRSTRRSQNQANSSDASTATSPLAKRNRQSTTPLRTSQRTSARLSQSRSTH